RASRFQRFILPGLAFKAVVIGGGYATGRELAEFFFPAGPAGGLLGLALTAVLWSLICALTFMFAWQTRSHDYRTFFYSLLGPFWRAFEFVYVFFILLILAVFGAAAGAIAEAMLGWPQWSGSLVLALSILAVVSFGNESVERLFKYASVFLYLVYFAFAVLALSAFGDGIAPVLRAEPSVGGWFSSGLTYAGYNVVGAVIILPVVRHFTNRRDAAAAGLLCGPLAALPAFVFFTCMIAFYPQIAGEALPSNFILERLDAPHFHIVFQLMIFVALLETSAGAVNALNERIAGVLARRGRSFPPRGRFAASACLLVIAMVVATHFGLIALIATGYRTLAFAILGVFVLPLATLGVYRLVKKHGRVCRTAPANPGDTENGKPS
ncbi:MAG: hypothetical protein ACLFWF_12585, partial [Alphaproteobacteria bacterium]